MAGIQFKTFMHKEGNHTATGLRTGVISLCVGLCALIPLSIPSQVYAQSDVTGISRPVVPEPQKLDPVPNPLKVQPSDNGSKTSKTGTIPSSQSPEVLTSGQLAQTVLGLLFVIFLLFGLLWVMKRSGFGSAGRVSGIYKVLHVSSLGPKEKIALLEVGDTWLLVGMTQHSINTLHTMPKDSVNLNTPSPQATEAFARLLEKIKKPQAST